MLLCLCVVSISRETQKKVYTRNSVNLSHLIDCSTLWNRKAPKESREKEGKTNEIKVIRMDIFCRCSFIRAMSSVVLWFSTWRKWNSCIAASQESQESKARDGARERANSRRYWTNWEEVIDFVSKSKQISSLLLCAWHSFGSLHSSHRTASSVSYCFGKLKWICKCQTATILFSESRIERKSIFSTFHHCTTFGAQR